MLIVVAEGKIITKQHKTHVGGRAQVGQQPSYRWQVLTLQLHDLERREFCLKGAVYRFDKAGFPHAPRAPEKRVVRAQPGGKAAGVVQKGIARPVHADQQVKRDPRYLRNRFQPIRLDVPDKGRGRRKVGCGQRRGCDTLQRRRDAVQGIFGHDLRSFPSVVSSSSSNSSISGS